MRGRTGFGFVFLLLVAVLLLVLLIVGQTLALFDYDLTVAWGLQESVEEVGELGVVWAKGFALGDTVIYIPLLLAGIIGLLRKRAFGFYALFGALAITAYWPIVNLYAVWMGRDILSLHSDKYVVYSIVLPLISIYGMWGMWFLHRARSRFRQDEEPSDFK